MTESAAIAIGARLKSIRAGQTQKEFAESLDIALATYQNYERGDRMPVADVLLALYRLGWNSNWVLTGTGPETLERLSNKAFGVGEEPGNYQSQALIPDKLTLAVQLAQQALDGDVLDPPDYAELLGLIYHALVNGLESAQVLAFAKPAARGLGVSNGRKTVGGSGKQTAG